jgi:DNA-binding MurR/RpiR family transcriptional regulator
MPETPHNPTSPKIAPTDTKIIRGKEPEDVRNDLTNLEISLLKRLQQNLSQLSPAETQIGEYILEHPRQILRLPIDQLARNIGISLGTLSKFCQTIGYSGFKELKLDLAAELKSHFQLDNSSIVLGDNLEEVANKAISANVEALLATLQGLDINEVARVIKALQEAQRIDLFGFGLSSVVALEAYHRFFRLGLRVNWLSDIALQAASSMLLTNGDVAMAFSYAGETGVTIDALRAARKNGATTIVITGNRFSPLAKNGDIVLEVAAREPTAFRRNLHISSRTAMQGLVDVIYLGLIQDSEQTRTSLKQTTAAVDNLRT